MGIFDFKLPKFKPYSFGSRKGSKRTLGKRDRDILYLRAKCRCESCNKRISQPEMEVGHRKAYSKGGATTLANSACLCHTCNKLQGTESLETLKKKLSGRYGKRPKSPRQRKKKSSSSFNIRDFI